MQKRSRAQSHHNKTRDQLNMRENAPLADLSHIHTPKPNPSRVGDIRRWMLAQAAASDAPVAGLALTISASGQIQAAARGIEPEHADLVIAQLDSLRTSLQAWVESEQAPQLPLCSVLHLRA
jgi:hypothetical protein